MFLFTLVLGVLFLPEADSLNCTCEGNLYGVCSNETIECPSQNYSCSAVTQVKSLGGANITEFNYKGCIKSELCFDVSINNGVYRTLQNSSCCSGDLCNANITYPKPDYKSTPNGKKCFSCDGDENCMKTLNCVGDENYCFTVTNNSHGLTVMTKGCASDKLCSDVFSPLLKRLVLLVSDQFTEPKISCCQGDYCNSASSTNSPSSPNSPSITNSPSNASSTNSPSNASSTNNPSNASSTNSPSNASSTNNPSNASSTNNPSNANSPSSTSSTSSTSRPSSASTVSPTLLLLLVPLLFSNLFS